MLFPSLSSNHLFAPRTQTATRVPSRPSRYHLALVAAAMALCLGVTLSLVATPAFAQLPNFTTVTSNAQTTFAPLITLIRYVIMVACIILAIWQGVQAARGGQPGGYINALLLLIVAGFAASPATWINLFGLTDVASNMTAWGF